ncbi:MAG TPA: hypothetical protein VH394_05190 [Thermoanaerobaculia bacterium]|nr:hypothetical protein [Thermoanaerobaculia bacterium]
MALLAGAAAFRFESRPVFSLALSTFAAWRGVSVGMLGFTFLPEASAVRWNAILCGVLFAGLGFVLKRTRRKAHFEPVAVHLGWLLILGGIAAGSRARGSPGPPRCSWPARAWRPARTGSAAFRFSPLAWLRPMPG